MSQMGGIIMADNRKEQECAELHRTIWGIANDLRGSVDTLLSRIRLSNY